LICAETRGFSGQQPPCASAHTRTTTGTTLAAALAGSPHHSCIV